MIISMALTPFQQQLHDRITAATEVTAPAEFRAAGFSPTGRTLAVATSSDLTLWTRY